MRQAEGPRILVVDDEAAIRDLLAQFLRAKGFETRTASGTGQALEYLMNEPFDLVISDVRMPGPSGLELLGQIRRDHPETGVLMLTGCEEVTMAVDAMKNGALDYLLKPFRLEDVESKVRSALDRRNEELGKVRYLRHLERKVEEQSGQLRRVLSHLDEASEFTLEALVAALDAREHETNAHSKRVSEYALTLAREAGVSGEYLDVVRRGAMLHDIGKIGITDSILLKPGRLTPDEWAQMRRHPEIGYWILNGVPSLRDAGEIVLSHHERFNGTGYPRGLSGQDIPLGGRIFSVVDTLDAITTHRPYQRGKSFAEARGEVQAHAGTQFDPEVVAAFLRIPEQVWQDIRRSSRAPRSIPEIAPLVLSV